MNQQSGFTEYLQGKDFARASIAIYTRSVMEFFDRTDKEESQITKADILKHLQHLKDQRGLQNVSRRMHLTGLNHYFTFLYHQQTIGENPCALLKIRGAVQISLYRIFKAEQLEQLFDDHYQRFVRNPDHSRTPTNRLMQMKLSAGRNAAVLSLLFGQGMTTTEIDRTLLQDMDLHKAVLKVRGGTRSNERSLHLKAEQVGLLMHYRNEIRPQFLTGANAKSEKLFLPYPTGNTAKDPESLIHLFKPLGKQLQTIEPAFLNFKQVRASVITHWLKTHGLRRTQYMAGHRYIRGTEYYLRNNIEDLTSDISKHHPF